jgi:carbon monoxide dehydrogenase subunit G
MWFEMRPVGLEFAQQAPAVYVMEAEVAAERRDVWRAVVDPKTWSGWFPGVKQASYDGPGPYGVGTVRRALVGRQRFDEVIVAWDEPRRWAYHITRATAPIATAQLECTELFDSPRGTRVRWTLACEPRLLFRLAQPFLPRTLRRLHDRAMANLEAFLRA